MDKNSSLVLFGIICFVIYQYYFQYKKKKKTLELLQNQWGKEHKDRYINFDRVKKYFDKSPHTSKSYQQIEENTINDLDLNDVFQLINRTYSSIGEQFMYFKLLTVDNSQKNISFTPIVNYFLKNEKNRIKIQLILQKLSTSHGYFVEQLIHDKFEKSPDYNWLSYFSNFLTILSLILVFKFPFLWGFLFILFIMNMGMHMLNKKNLDHYSEGIAYLFQMLKVKKQLHPFLKDIVNDIDTRGIQKIKWYSFFIKFSSEENGDPIKQILFWFLEIIKVIFNIEVIAFYLCIKKIEQQRDEIDQLFQYIGIIDTAQSIASVLDSEQITCKPNFTKNDTFKVKNIIHPLIPTCVPNSFYLNKRGMLLTGSNMSGKTTFIRTIGVNVILAQSFNFCFGKEYNAPFFKIYSSIRINDSIKESSSYYLQEVKMIKKIVDASEHKVPSLFIMDEIFKGTNTLERVKGANAILSYIGKPPHYTFIATHDLELTELQRNNYELWHFAEDIENNDIHFDHKLKEGKLTRLNAIKILSIYDYPEEIIKQSKTLI